MMISRRDFLAASAAATWLTCSSELLSSTTSPSEKLNIGVIGVTRRGAANIRGVQSENIVALCDIDERHLGEAKERFPKAATYIDWRKMLDDKSVEAVVVSTPDHMHAAATVAAIKSGRHVYCEKPLAHSIYESRIVAQTAAKYKVATQMGNQNHATGRLRSVVEFVRAGELGAVREVVAWSAKSDNRFSPGDRPKEGAPVPSHVHWDLWLGPAPVRPYHPTAYHPNKWRGWWDFGEGNFGDMACHIVDAAFWALDLGHPVKIETEGPPVHPESAPPWLIVRYQFPGRQDRPPVKLTWYDGTKAPPQHLVDEIKLPGQGVLFVGEKGRLLFPHSRGEIQLLVDSKVVPVEFPMPTLPRPASHHAEWIEACKTGSKTYSNFAYASRLTETVLAGVVAYRTGETLHWDGEHMKAENCSAADRYVRLEYRKGWTL